MFVTKNRQKSYTAMTKSRSGGVLKSKAMSHSVIFCECVCEIKDTDDALPVKDDKQCPSWQLFLRIVLISHCLHIETVKRKVALRSRAGPKL